MTEDLQQLLEKIQRDGVEKAQTEAEAILKRAKAEAETLVSDAKKEADKIRHDAETEADAYARRAEETIGQSARDILLHVERSVTSLFESLVRKDVDTALSSEATVVPLVKEAVTAYLKNNEQIAVSAPEKMIGSLRDGLSALIADGVTVVTDKTSGTGFRVKLADGRIEHDFTGAAVAEALCKQLRPGLASLIKP